jgi:hypothetical protein
MLTIVAPGAICTTNIPLEYKAVLYHRLKISPMQAGGEISETFLVAKISSYRVQYRAS